MKRLKRYIQYGYVLNRQPTGRIQLTGIQYMKKTLLVMPVRKRKTMI